MGQGQARQGRLRKSLRRLSRAAFNGGGGASLSHSFAAAASEPRDLVNVNSATEELLMTLPGVTRKIAQAIVDHRQTIGRFRRVDDLALVSGMGAERLDAIRSDICVRKAPSESGSRTHSSDSIGSVDSCRPRIDVNAATVFQLQCLDGMNQEIAANVIEYRNKKGSFRSLDDLIKVKGVDKLRLSTIKPQLSISHDPPTVVSLHKSVSVNGVANGAPAARHLGVNGHRKSLSAPNPQTQAIVLPPPNGLSFRAVKDVYDLLSACSIRPILEDSFTYVRNNKFVVRIASWNLHEFDRAKANNLGVREVICRTILENRLSILGIQDVLDEDALKSVCQDLNTPMLRRIIEWKDNSKKWDYYLVKGSDNRKNVGFIYETANNKLSIMAKENTEVFKNIDNEKSLFQYGYIDFTINDTKISILNVQLSDNNVDYSKTVLCEKVDKLLNVNKGLVIVGDFYSSEHVKDLATCYKPVIEPETSILVELEDGPMKKDSGNTILIAGETDSKYVGISGVIRTGLCHLAIPRGWVLGGPLSPYCPIWAEFYVN